MLRGAKQLLTLRGPGGVRRGSALRDLSVVEDGSVLIRDGVIAAIGSARRIENLTEARQAVEVPVQGKVVMPAFVDAGFNLSINRTNAVTTRKKAPEFHDEAAAVFRTSLAHGTLWAEVRARAYDNDYESVIQALRLVTKIGQNLLSVVRTWRLETAPRPDEDVVNRVQRILGYLVQRKLIDCVELSAADFRYESCLNFLKKARSLGIGIKAEWPSGSMPDFENFVLEVAPQSVQLPLEVRSQACAMLVRSPSVMVFSPGQELAGGNSRGSGLRALVDAGAAVALASGYDSRQAASINMQMTLALAVIRQQLTAEEAITAVTVNAACALGIGDRMGTLEAGKQADLMVLAVSDYRELTRQFGINHVAMIWRKGKLAVNRTKWRPPGS